MRFPNLFPSCLIATTLLSAVPALRADEGHDHDHHDHASAAGAVMSSHDGMAALHQHIGEMDKEIAAGNLDGIHGHDEAIQVAVKNLDKDTALTPERKKRVQGYVKNVQRLSAKLHNAADGKKLDQARKDIGKLKAQVDLLDKQFPHSHKPGAAQPAKEGGAHAHPGNHPGK